MTWHLQEGQPTLHLYENGVLLGLVTMTKQGWRAVRMPYLEIGHFADQRRAMRAVEESSEAGK